MAGIKLSQLPAATSSAASDLLMIVQNGISKQITRDTLITASFILNQLLTVDGVDSGLDADLWRGMAPEEIAVPTGMVAPFAMAIAPTGWFECNGSALPRTDTLYVKLYEAIGTIFGAGDGSTTFNVPDLRGEFIRGWDHARNIDPGRAFGSTQADDFKSHQHMWNMNNTLLYQYGGGNPNTLAGGGYNQYTSNTGGTETRPRNVALMYCIKL